MDADDDGGVWPGHPPRRRVGKTTPIQFKFDNRSGDGETET